MYAVAVRAVDNLYLLLRIRRSAAGDVYAIFPRDEPHWNPHASYHATGRHHQKSFNYATMARDRQAPTVDFKDAENLVTFGVSSDEPKAIGVTCDPGKFDAVFEIPVAELRPERYRTAISVDLAEPGATAIIPSTARVVRQAAFDDAIPWIVVTLYEQRR